jgi:hypothetical protein
LVVKYEGDNVLGRFRSRRDNNTEMEDSNGRRDMDPINVAQARNKLATLERQ